jgi:hypothetical protein
MARHRLSVCKFPLSTLSTTHPTHHKGVYREDILSSFYHSGMLLHAFGSLQYLNNSPYTSTSFLPLIFASDSMTCYTTSSDMTYNKSSDRKVAVLSPTGHGLLPFQVLRTNTSTTTRERTFKCATSTYYGNHSCLCNRVPCRCCSPSPFFVLLNQVQKSTKPPGYVPGCGKGFDDGAPLRGVHLSTPPAPLFIPIPVQMLGALLASAPDIPGALHSTLCEVLPPRLGH